MTDFVMITDKDLPLSCPRQGTPATFEHPRVYLALNKEQPQVVCPYCNTHYQLSDAE